MSNRHGVLQIALSCRAQLQSERIETNEASRVALVVCSPRRIRPLADRHIAFHRRNLWIVEALGTFAAADDDVALVKFEAHQACHVALRFSDKRL